MTVAVFIVVCVVLAVTMIPMAFMTGRSIMRDMRTGQARPLGRGRTSSRSQDAFAYWACIGGKAATTLFMALLGFGCLAAICAPLVRMLT